MYNTYANTVSSIYLVIFSSFDVASSLRNTATVLKMVKLFFETLSKTLKAFHA